MNDADINEPLTVDNKSGKVIPTPKGIKLNTIDSVRVEMASVYRGMKSGSIETSDGTKLVYVLGQIGKMIEAQDAKERIRLLEVGANETSPQGRTLSDFYADVSIKPDAEKRN